ncbi:MAG: hypothetical protein ABIR80_21880 [Opitutaceae bacterium]
MRIRATCRPSGKTTQCFFWERAPFHSENGDNCTRLPSRTPSAELNRGRGHRIDEKQLKLESPNIMNTGKKGISMVAACGLVLSVLPAVFGAHDVDKHFKAMDADGDGKITRAEHATAAKKMFAQCDANKDGIVTAAEMDSSMAAQGEKLAVDDKTSAEKIQMIDQNSDGKLTAAEHEAGTEKMFGQMDKNGDGSLSKEECEEGMKLMKKAN